MRDLKHLTYFEDLLQEADDALVVQAPRQKAKNASPLSARTHPNP